MTKLLSVNGVPNPKVFPLRDPASARQMQRTKDALDVLFETIELYAHASALPDPATRELFRDLRGTLNGFMRGVD